MTNQANTETILTGGDNEWHALYSIVTDDTRVPQFHDEGTQCVHCDERATRVVALDAVSYWAVCRGCADESAGDSFAASQQSEYEMDYYAGYE